jgi:hypothetical protein
MFHRNPYSVLEGGKLYMMYLIDFIVCFDLGSKSFSKIPLPGILKTKTRSWYDYTVTNYSEGRLVLVHYTHGNLDKWVMTHTPGTVIWNLEASMDLVPFFGPRISCCSWSSLFFEQAVCTWSDDFFSVQLRSASPKARFVLLTLAFDKENLYEVDMVKGSVEQMPIPYKDGMVGHIYHLSEPWPPKV